VLFRLPKAILARQRDVSFSGCSAGFGAILKLGLYYGGRISGAVWRPIFLARVWPPSRQKGVLVEVVAENPESDGLGPG